MTTRQSLYNGVSSSTNCPNDDYDALNRPRTWEQTGPNGFHALSHYKYDQVNREIATWRDEDDNRGERFAYEPTNQLASAAYNGHNVANGPPTDATRTVTYAYTPDKLSRSSMTDAGTTTTTTSYTPDALNQYTNVSGRGYTYDNNFNLTGTDAFLGVYDAANHLVSASNSGSIDAPLTTAGFVYDGLGRCVKRTLNGVAALFVFDGWKPIAEWDEYQNLLAWNVYGPGADEILLRHQDAYGYIRFHLDRHGNVAFLLDNVGVVREKYTYDAFGRPKVTDLNGEHPRSFSYYGHCFLFQGREYIKELGIYDYRNRFYYPALGRFLQTDPTGFGAGDMNLFRYCGDDPIDGSDPTGLIGDFMWDFAKYSDPTNTSQGSFKEYTHGAYSGGGDGGGDRSLGRTEQQSIRISAGLNAMGAKADHTSTDRDNRHPVTLLDSKLLDAMESKRSEINAKSVAKMSQIDYLAYQYKNNTAPSEFYHRGWYEYTGSIARLHGTWSSDEINYFAIGQAAAAHHESLKTMDTLIHGWKDVRATFGMGSGIQGGERLWARAGYGYYDANRTLEGGY